MIAGNGRMADLRALRRALAAERAAALGESPAALASIVQRIEGLCARLEAGGPAVSAAEAALLADVRAAASKRLRELSAVLAGMRDAEALVAGLRSAGELRTYGPEGQPRPLEATGSRLERRS